MKKGLLLSLCLLFVFLTGCSSNKEEISIKNTDFNFQSSNEYISVINNNNIKQIIVKYSGEGGSICYDVSNSKEKILTNFSDLKITAETNYLVADADLYYYFIFFDGNIVSFNFNENNYVLNNHVYVLNNYKTLDENELYSAVQCINE